MHRLSFVQEEIKNHLRNGSCSKFFIARHNGFNRRSSRRPDKEGFGNMIIDIHSHFLADRTWPEEWRTPEFLIKDMDKWGIDKAVIVCGDPLIGGDYREGNTKVANAISKFPDRLIGFAWIHPTHASGIDAAVKEAERCVRELKFKGLKLHPATEMYSYTSQRYCYPIIEAAIRLHAPVFCHTGDPPSCPYSHPVLLADLADRFPDAKLILGHLGNRLWDDAVWAMSKHDNLVAETSFGQTSGITSMVKAVGAERVVMGSDWPTNSFGASLGHIRGAFIPDRDKELIMGENAAKLLGMD